MQSEDAEKSKKREAAERTFCRGLKAEPCLFNAKCSRHAGAILPYAASVKGKMRNAVKRRRERERKQAEGESGAYPFNAGAAREKF